MHLSVYLELRKTINVRKYLRDIKAQHEEKEKKLYKISGRNLSRAKTESIAKESAWAWPEDSQHIQEVKTIMNHHG